MAADLWTEVQFATRQLSHVVSELPPDSQDVPSLCTGWTRGHVLTHIARNADAVNNLVTWAVTGVETPMYPSQAARAADIEAGAGRSIPELLADVEEASSRLHQAATQLRRKHESVVMHVDGESVPVRSVHLAGRRLREVVYHTVDLDAGFSFADIPSDLRMNFLDDQVVRFQDDARYSPLAIASAEGDFYPMDGATARITGTQGALLGWLARGLTDGVDGDLPAHVPLG